MTLLEYKQALEDILTCIDFEQWDQKSQVFSLISRHIPYITYVYVCVCVWKSPLAQWGAHVEPHGHAEWSRKQVRFPNNNAPQKILLYNVH